MQNTAFPRKSYIQACLAFLNSSGLELSAIGGFSSWDDLRAGNGGTEFIQLLDSLVKYYGSLLEIQGPEQFAAVLEFEMNGKLYKGLPGEKKENLQVLTRCLSKLR